MRTSQFTDVGWVPTLEAPLLSERGRSGERGAVQAHGFEFEVEATPEEVWRALHPRLAAAPAGRADS